MEKNLPKLIHLGWIQGDDGAPRYLYLRKKGPTHFVWYEDSRGNGETETPVKGSSAEEALRVAHKHWRHHAFRTVICGFRYTLPERDEHGINALFHQMAASYSSSNGVYFDEEAGNICFVNYASQEARDICHKLKSENRL